MTDEPKYCRDCKYVGAPVSELSPCLHPEALEHFPPNLVTGDPAPSAPRHARMMRVFGSCGSDGALFEARGEGGPEPSPAPMPAAGAVA
jgi:hypothetical protein